MKKSLALSVIIHVVLLTLAMSVILAIPDAKKVEPIKIQILIPREIQQQIEPVKSPQNIVQEIKSQPKPPLSDPIVRPKVQPNIKPTPMASIEPTPVPVVSNQKTIDVSVQKALDNSPPKVAVSKPAPIETMKGDPNAKENYIAYLRKLIDERKIYPKNAKRLKQMGTVKVKFRVSEDGTLKNIAIVDSSGFELLDQAASDLLENIGHIRPFPKEMGNEPIDVILPIEYTLR